MIVIQLVEVDSDVVSVLTLIVTLTSNEHCAHRTTQRATTDANRNEYEMIK